VLNTPYRASLNIPRQTVIVKMPGNPSGTITAARMYRLPATRTWFNRRAIPTARNTLRTSETATNSHVVVIDVQNCESPISWT